MNVLLLCHRFPFPPKDGSRVRAFNMIKHLAAQHRVSVASLARSPAEAAQEEKLREHCHEVLVETVSAPAAVVRMAARLPSGGPSSMGYFYSPRLARRVRAALDRGAFDLIVVHCSSVAPYVAACRGIPKLLDFADMDSQKWLAYARFKPFPLSLGYWLEGRKLERAEAQLARRFDVCTCITQAEQQTLNALAPEVPSGWFPNGVDLDYFTVASAGYDPARICFVGRMDYFPNQQAMIAFCRDVLPRIRAVRPEASLTIVGAEPSRAVRALGKLPGVEVTGTVADVRPYVQSAVATVAPLGIARGTQNKILESWAMGVPVVASSRAAAGVDALPGEHLLVADSAEAFAAAVVGLITDAEQRRRLSAAGRARVEEIYTWPAAMARFDRLIDDCLARRPR